MKVLITGGELFNKGAQSMTFSVVSEVRKRFPDADICLLSAPDCRRPEQELGKYRFRVLPWDIRMKLRKLPLLGSVFKNKYFSVQQERDMWQAVQEADLAIDVSGFCLSSQFSKMKAIDYLSNIYLFKRYGIPVILFPQSFGPFEYQGAGASLIVRQIRKLLQYPNKIFAREQDGLEKLAELGIKDNVQRSLDTVLLTKKLEYQHIFNGKPDKSQLSLATGAVGIVPNQKVFVKNQGNALMDNYQTMIEHLLSKGKTVYLLRHSFEDKSIVQDLKQLFADDDNVVALEDDFSALELTDIINQFDFIIASRYHAVVHAYKCYVPAVVLGWAIKYQALTSAFQQLPYCFDVRSVFEQQKILSALDHMLDNHAQESQLINDTLSNMDLDKLFNEALDIAK